MATTYRYRVDQQEQGPVSFQELVQLVRDETLRADSPVMADWQQEWVHAAEVVGLFHTAGRDDVLEKWEQEQREKRRHTLLSQDDGELTADTFAGMISEQESVLSEKEALRKLDEADAAYLANLRQRVDEHSSIYPQDVRIDDSISESIRALDNDEAGKSMSVHFGMLNAGLLHLLFRLTVSLLIANLALYVILQISDYELLRFPSRFQSSETARYFPVYGRCSFWEFVVLMIDAFLVFSVIGYGTARVLELFVEE